MGRRFKAWLYLSYHFSKHGIKKLLLLKPPGLSAFMAAYRHDRIFAVTAPQRALFNAFSGCITCRCCDEVCPELKINRRFLAPSYVVGSFSRSLTDHHFFAVGETCTECQLCEEACPQKVPIKELLNLMRAPPETRFESETLDFRARQGR